MGENDNTDGGQKGRTSGKQKSLSEVQRLGKSPEDTVHGKEVLRESAETGERKEQSAWLDQHREGDRREERGKDRNET